MTSHKNGLPSRLRQFFRENPGEELTFADIQVKFDCNETAARDAVRTLRAGKTVETVHVIRLRPAAKAEAKEALA